MIAVWETLIYQLLDFFFGDHLFGIEALSSHTHTHTCTHTHVFFSCLVAERDVAAISPGVFWQTRTRSDWVERQDDRVSAGVYIYIYI